MTAAADFAEAARRDFTSLNPQKCPRQLTKAANRCDKFTFSAELWLVDSELWKSLIRYDFETSELDWSRYSFESVSGIGRGSVVFLRVNLEFVSFWRVKLDKRFGSSNHFLLIEIALFLNTLSAFPTNPSSKPKQNKPAAANGDDDPERNLDFAFHIQDLLHFFFVYLFCRYFVLFLVFLLFWQIEDRFWERVWISRKCVRIERLEKILA